MTFWVLFSFFLSVCFEYFFFFVKEWLYLVVLFESHLWKARSSHCWCELHYIMYNSLIYFCSFIRNMILCVVLSWTFFRATFSYTYCWYLFHYVNTLLFLYYISWLVLLANGKWVSWNYLFYCLICNFVLHYYLFFLICNWIFIYSLIDFFI